jgi:uncharacterized protein YmfQ (DUF2313 family)
MELVRIDARASDLIREADPRSSTELLSDWEELTGLPGICGTIGDTIEDRRNQVVAKLTQLGKQNKQFFISLAATIGYTITVNDIEEYQEFKAGSRAGDRLTNGSWVYTFTIHAPAFTVRYFKAGANVAGDRLLEYGDELFECLISSNKPAHTEVIFTYG